jgi:hypothetical protein
MMTFNKIHYNLATSTSLSVVGLVLKSFCTRNMLLRIESTGRYTPLACESGRLQHARVVQWLERRRKDMVILKWRVQIPLWNVGAGSSDETINRGPMLQ